MIRYRYQEALSPAAPFVHLTLVHPTTGATLPGVPGQVDTAADRTVLPTRLVEALGLPQVRQLRVAGLGGELGTLPVFAVRVGVHDLAPQLQAAFSCDGEPWVLLGRDVLNQYRVILDGAGLGVEIERPTGPAVS